MVSMPDALSGFVYKKSPSALRVMMPWQKRYLTLSSGTLSWWSSPDLAVQAAGKHENALGYIDLSANDIAVNRKENTNCFTLVAIRAIWKSSQMTNAESNRVLEFDATDSEETVEAWCSGIQAHTSWRPSAADGPPRFSILDVGAEAQQVAASDEQLQLTNEVIHEGELLKREVSSRTSVLNIPNIDFQPRWAVLLTSQYLVLYMDQSKSKISFQYPIQKVTQIQRFTSEDPPPPGVGVTYAATNPFGFVLDGNPYDGADRHLYYFDAVSEDELKLWEGAFRRCITNIDDQSENSELNLLVEALLNRKGRDSAVSALIDFLQDEDCEVRHAATQGLGRFAMKGCKASEAALVAHTQREDHPLVKYLAQRMLSRCKTSTDDPQTTESQSDNAEFNLLLEELLNRKGRDSAVAALIELLQDRDCEVRHAATQGLGRLAINGCEASITALVAHIQREDHPLVKYLAQRTLRRMTPHADQLLKEAPPMAKAAPAPSTAPPAGQRETLGVPLPACIGSEGPYWRYLGPDHPVAAARFCRDFPDGIHYSAKWVLTAEEGKHWLTEGKSWFVLDLLAVNNVSGFGIRNSLGQESLDRSTADYTIHASQDRSEWSLAAAGSLKTHSELVQVRSSVVSMRYVKFTMESYIGCGGGLAYFAAYGYLSLSLQDMRLKGEARPARK